MESMTATVLQSDKIINIPLDELRKGDLVLVPAGDVVPADLKLVEARNLEVDDWELTGEILAIERKLSEDDIEVARSSGAMGWVLWWQQGKKPSMQGSSNNLKRVLDILINDLADLETV